MLYLRLFVLLFSILIMGEEILYNELSWQFLFLLSLLVFLNIFFWYLDKLQYRLSTLVISLSFLLLTNLIHIVGSNIWTHGLYAVVLICLAIQFKNQKILFFNTITISSFYVLIEYFFIRHESIQAIFYDMILFFLIALISFELVIEDYSNKDYLTGLYNFKGFLKVIEKIWNKGPKQFHVVFIDFINFKGLNEKHGAQEGDDILRLVARTLKRRLGNGAILSRYEGDCFVVGFHGDYETTKSKIDHALQTIPLTRIENTPLRYTLSCATYPDDAKDLYQLTQIAEHRIEIEKKILHEKEEQMKYRVETLSAIGQLAAGLAHEIRNPLTSVRGLIQLSAEENLNFKKWEKIILPEIDRMNELLTDFLHLAQNRPAKKQKWNINEIIQDVYSLLQPKALLLGHEIELKQKNNSSYFINADKQQMQQVFINLIQNALEAIQHPKGSIKISFQQSGDEVSISIADNGKGIPPEKIHHIFEPFYTTKEEGTGLGLAICHRIVTDHQGTIKVYSKINQGTTFTITLPIAEKIVENDNDNLVEI